MKQHNTLTLLLCLLTIQMLFWTGIPSIWQGTRNISPEYHIIPPIPSPTTVRALSFGDEELMFRTLALQLQNAGDTYGRFTSLTQYDYSRLQQWLLLLDTLNKRSHFAPALASYIYSQTPNTPDITYMVDYLDAHTKNHVASKWWWIAQAVYLANYKLHNPQRALELAYRLTNAPKEIDLPLWARQMPAFIHAKLHEKEAALAIITNIANDIETIPPNEIRFMNHFIQERLGYIDQTVETLKGY